jgi:hypothetical protein
MEHFPGGQQELDDVLFECCSLLGNIPRKYLGIQASSKGMMAGVIFKVF